MNRIIVGLLAIVTASAAVSASNLNTNNSLDVYYHYEFDASGNILLSSKQEVPSSTANAFACDGVPEEICSRAYSEQQVNSTTKYPLNVNNYTAQWLHSAE